jgi:branched-chain amino acid transport system ATP-binding protein
VTALLQASSLSRRFGGLVAVDAVNITIEEGEVRGLIGPNGAGKTTLLNLIGGQIAPSSGRLLFGGRELSRERPDRRAALGVRRTFQNLRLFREMTVLENVMVGLHASTHAEALAALLRTPRQRTEERWMAEESARALALVGLADRANDVASALAYGHRRLLEIARAIVAGPRLLLLDEPAAGLNATESAQFVGLVRKIAGGGVAIILVEHHMDVVMSACTHITVLNYGRLLAEGSPAEIRKNPDVLDAYLGYGALEDENDPQANKETRHSSGNQIS